MIRLTSRLQQVIGHDNAVLAFNIGQLVAKYILKIISGDLRIGLKESLVEEAIAKAFDEPFRRVQRANMMLASPAVAAGLAIWIELCYT